MTCPRCALEIASGPHGTAAECLDALRREVARLRYLLALTRRALEGAPDY